MINPILFGLHEACPFSFLGINWGVLDLKDMDCDSFVASSHKFFCGPKETGILYVKKTHAKKTWPNTFGYNGHIVVEMDLPEARCFETLGQRDDVAISTILVTIKIHQTIGLQNVQNRVIYLADRLKQGWKNSDFRLVTPESPEFSHGVVIMDIPSEQRAKVADMLYYKFGIARSTTGGLQLCPHICNTEAHIDRAFVGINEMRTFFTGKGS